MFLKLWVFRRWWVDIVEYTLVDAKVHEGNSQLFLDLSFFLDVLFNNHAHLLNCIHLSLMSNKDPVFKLLVHINCTLSFLFQLIKSPVSNLDKSIPENTLLNFDCISHFLDINTFLNLIVLFSNSATFFGIFARLFCSFSISNSVGLSDIVNYLLL